MGCPPRLPSRPSSAAPRLLRSCASAGRRIQRRRRPPWLSGPRSFCALAHGAYPPCCSFSALLDLVLCLLHATRLALHRNRLSTSCGQGQCQRLLCTGIVRERHKETSDARIKVTTSTTLALFATHTSPSNTQRESGSSQRRVSRGGREGVETARCAHGRPHRHCETQ